MKEIELNGKTYVSKEDYMELEKSKTKIEYRDQGPIKMNEPLVDDCNIVGIGSVEYVSGEYIATKFSIEYVKKAIKILETMDVDNIDFVWGNERPIVIGKRDGNKFSGVVIAPRVSND